MANRPIRLTCPDYAWVMPLGNRRCRPGGIPADAPKMPCRATNDPTVHGGESSMAGHLRRSSGPQSGARGPSGAALSRREHRQADKTAIPLSIAICLTAPIGRMRSRTSA
jgi:hypothetical protein